MQPCCQIAASIIYVNPAASYVLMLYCM